MTINLCRTPPARAFGSSPRNAGRRESTRNGSLSQHMVLDTEPAGRRVEIHIQPATLMFNDLGRPEPMAVPGTMY